MIQELLGTVIYSTAHTQPGETVISAFLPLAKQEHRHENILDSISASSISPPT